MLFLFTVLTLSLNYTENKSIMSRSVWRGHSPGLCAHPLSQLPPPRRKSSFAALAEPSGRPVSEVVKTHPPTPLIGFYRYYYLILHVYKLTSSHQPITGKLIPIPSLQLKLKQDHKTLLGEVSVPTLETLFCSWLTVSPDCIGST